MLEDLKSNSGKKAKSHMYKSWEFSGVSISLSNTRILLTYPGIISRTPLCGALIPPCIITP